MPGMKQLIFFTESFPYGKGESFIENEIEYLSREFDRIYILPKTSSTQEQRSLPANCIVFPPIFRSSGELVFKGLFCFSPLFYFFKKSTIAFSPTSLFNWLTFIYHSIYHRTQYHRTSLITLIIITIYSFI